jgi:phenylacetate-CoA ligase
MDGRADEVFRYGAVHVHPHVLRSVLVATPGVREYQVRQTGHGIDVAAVTDGPVDVTALGARLGRGLRSAGLTAPQVTVGLVGAIGRNPQTGKARRFVPAGD